MATLVTIAGLRWWRVGRGRSIRYGLDDGDALSNDIRTIATIEKTSAFGRWVAWVRPVGHAGFSRREDAFEWVAEKLKDWKQPPKDDQ